MPKELCYSRREPVKGMPYIFLTEGTLEEGVLEEGETVDTLCDRYFEDHRKLVMTKGHALLVDLRGKEPRFESVPVVHKLPEHS